MDLQENSDEQMLSEALRLLRELNYTDLGMFYKDVGVLTTRNDRDHITKRDIRILDTISAALATGKPGDVVAATFEYNVNHKPMGLVLAKNEAPGPNDERKATDFLTAMTDPTKNSGLHIFDTYLMVYCRLNLMARIERLQKIMQTCKPILVGFLDRYDAQRPEEEFRDVKTFLGAVLSHPKTILPSISHEIIKYLIDEVARRSKPSLRTMSEYSSLAIAANTLMLTRFFNQFVADCKRLAYQPGMEWREHLKNLQTAVKLKTALEQICQFVGGIRTVNKYMRMWFGDGGHIPHRWVSQNFGGIAVVRLDDYSSVASRALEVPGSPPIEQTLDKLRAEHPRIDHQWPTHDIHLTVHAELRIILDHHALPSVAGPAMQQAIGCSKRSCLCCTIWIDAFNEENTTQWMMGGSHGKPYETWRLPNFVNAHNANTSVSSRVVLRLRDLLQNLTRREGAMYDEYRSSGDEDENYGPALYDLV